jgi:hypothetical protein
VTRILDQLEPGVGERGGVGVAVRGRHDPISGAPDDESARLRPPEGARAESGLGHLTRDELATLQLLLVKADQAG